jgi:hypothetical protein
VFLSRLLALRGKLQIDLHILLSPLFAGARWCSLCPWSSSNIDIKCIRPLLSLQLVSRTTGFGRRAVHTPRMTRLQTAVVDLTYSRGSLQSAIAHRSHDSHDSPPGSRAPAALEKGM